MQARWIGIGVVAGVLVLGGGALWWFGSGSKRQEGSQPRPEAPISGELGSGGRTTAPSTVDPETTPPQTPVASAGAPQTPPTPAGPPQWSVNSGGPRAANQPVPQLQPLPPNSFSVTVLPLPAGAIKRETADEREVARLNEPGLVKFHVSKGLISVWHWSRALSYYGATPVDGTYWAIVRGGRETGSLLVSLGGGQSYRVEGGEPLWAGDEGALFLIQQQDRFGLLLTDAQFKPVRAAWIPTDYRYASGWRRDADGRFRFRLYNPDGEYRVDLQTGAVSPPPAAYQLQQTTLLVSDCGGWGYGHQVKVYQGEQVRYSFLDAVAPRFPAFRGSPVFGDGKSAVIGTNGGPAVLDLATGSLQGAPELRALGSPYLLASPAFAQDVATIPEWQSDGSYRIRVGTIGRSRLYQEWSLKPERGPSGTDVRVNSEAYWSQDGISLQVAVSYPPSGGHCGGADPTDTHLSPVVVKGDWKGSLQVRVKAAVSLYALQGQKLGAVLQTVSPQTVLTVKRIEWLQTKEYALVVALPEGEGALIVDPSRLEWVPPTN